MTPWTRPAAAAPPAGTRARIGLFGGSFDPPHQGHLHVAQTALKRLQLDQVWWFPTPGNPLKAPPGAYEQRFSGVQKLISRSPAFRVSRIEQGLGLRYSYELVSYLRRHCRHAQLVWIIGADSLASLHLWKNYEALARTLPLVSVARPGHLRAPLSSRFARQYAACRIADRAAPAIFSHKLPAWTHLPAPLHGVSSTQIRTAREKQAG